MSNRRNLTAYLLLGVLSIVGLGAAVLGIVQEPNNVSLGDAVTNTLSAANYSEVLTENTAQGQQSDYLTFQSPDRLGGYIQSGDKRTYVVVIGNVEYQSVTVSADAPTSSLKYYRQASQGAIALDPAHGYLPYAKQAKNPSGSDGTYTFTLTRQGQTGTFTYTVSGKYISSFNLVVKSNKVDLTISQVGTSPPVVAPPASQIAGTSK
jgi:FlaG/FlaF family flagellin (archaellin)